MSHGVSSLYRKLLPLINRFVMIRQGMLSQMYVGRLLEVDSDFVQLQTFHADGTAAAVWTISLSTITEFVSESRQLDMLALKVKWASSPEVDNDVAVPNVELQEDTVEATTETVEPKPKKPRKSTKSSGKKE